MTRLDNIKQYGLAVIEADELYWRELGFSIDYATGLLLSI